VLVLETLGSVDFLACRVAPARIIRVNWEATTSLTQGGPSRLAAADGVAMR
jgi:hypothetical protein